jgi:hypothetical protein
LLEQRTKARTKQFSLAKEVRSFIDDDWREAVEQMQHDVDDFELSCYRFIKADKIDKIMCEELSNDEYVLGCAVDWFLADVLDIDIDVIQAMQSADAYEAIGKLVISTNKLNDYQQSYVSNDGYGHHFAHYDHNEHELCNADYYAFQVN